MRDSVTQEGLPLFEKGVSYRHKQRPRRADTRRRGVRPQALPHLRSAAALRGGGFFDAIYHDQTTWDVRRNAVDGKTALILRSENQ